MDWYSRSPLTPLKICCVCVEGCFIFHRTQLFGDNPVPWDVNNKTMSFSLIKNVFFDLRTRNKILKMLREAKQYIFNPAFILGILNVLLDERIFQMRSQN